MTGAIAMTTFTPEAEARLEEYCRQVRSALARDPEADPDEVEADIREHVAAEFHAAVRPVTAVELEAILVRLGPPGGWASGVGARAPAVEPFDWRGFVTGVRRRMLGVFAVLWRGPEDWRLAYLAFGLFCVGVLPTPLAVLLLPAYIFGRAGIELSRERGDSLAGRRWLLYPPVVLVSLVLLLTVTVALPLGLTVGAFHDFDEAARRTRYREQDPQTQRVNPWVRSATTAEPDEVERLVEAAPVPRGWKHTALGWFTAAGAFAGWWTIVGLFFWAFPRWPVAILHPLLDGYDGRHGLKLAGFAGLGFLIWVGFAVRLVEKAGLG